MELNSDTKDYFKNIDAIPKIVEGSKGDYIFYVATVLKCMGYNCEPERTRNKSIEIAIKNFQHDLGVAETGCLYTKGKEYLIIKDYVINYKYLWE